MLSFGQQVIDFNTKLEYSENLPEGFAILNPYHDNPETLKVMQAFYDKFYSDSNSRKFIIGINPSRHGAGVTGIPFTDTKRLKSSCDIEMQSAHTHEISSVFMYDMIAAFGGVNLFYQNFYINSPFPLAIVRQTKNKGWINANYYDDPKLFEAVKPFMIKSLKAQIKLNLETNQVYILGKKNAVFINRLNKEAKLFDKAIVLEHPRYIQQYKSKEKLFYIEKYLNAFNYEE
ncbi:SMUG2 DNA glycosylase family protein [Paenimyroides tangerinum]|uniref:SMUG2 DNA glycosylase family protein n=1 Tax=Paenimyroides tangerinum TaxID=2488728 RepID=A0A3P3VYW9_9FLAO|nr:SMUG2 DNA glycosylase family protein [Paenimyroides tangerinum]RRJ88012.1 SMUG2 DNA glycosylase family protein [Paenimyroides tangerinum]